MANVNKSVKKQVEKVAPVVVAYEDQDISYDNMVIERPKDYRAALFEIKDMIKKGIHVEKILKFIESML